MPTIAQVQDRFHLHDGSAQFFETLPAATYALCLHPEKGLYLERVDDLQFPNKVYGSVDHRVHRVTETYLSRPASTGALFRGQKGSGKSMTISKIAMGLKDTHGHPVILINSPIPGNILGSFLQKLGHPIVVVFDEFEKVYAEAEYQRTLLTLFDGTFKMKVLYLFSVNNSSELVDELISRPGRIFYSFQYHGLEEDFVKGYLDDVLVNKDYLEEMLLIAMRSNMSFDEIKACVEEMNRYDLDPAAAYLDLNISISYSAVFALQVRSIEGLPEEIKSDEISIVDGEVSLRDKAVSYVSYNYPNPGSTSYEDLFNRFPDPAARSAAIKAVTREDQARPCHEPLARMVGVFEVNMETAKLKGKTIGSRTMDIGGGITLSEKRNYPSFSVMMDPIYPKIVPPKIIPLVSS